MKALEQYHLPTLPEGFKKKFWIDSFGNTVCVIYEKDNRNNVVSVGVAWLNESDKYVKDRVKGKAIAYGRAFKSWKKPMPTKGKGVTFTIRASDGKPIYENVSFSSLYPKQ